MPAVAALIAAGGSFAQTPARLDPIVITATRTEERAFDLPVAIDSVSGDQIQQDQLQVNLSESPVEPAAVRNFFTGASAHATF